MLGDGGPGVLLADDEEAKVVAGGMMAGRLGGDPEVMLRDVRFVIGDYVAVAILPPLGNGNVAPGLGAGMGRGGRDVRAGEMGDQYGGGKMGGPRENGFGGGFRGGEGEPGVVVKADPEALLYLVGSGEEVRGCQMGHREVVMEGEEVGIGGESVEDNGFIILC